MVLYTSSSKRNRVGINIFRTYKIINVIHITNPNIIYILFNIPCECNIALSSYPCKVNFPNFYPRKQKFPTGGTCQQVAALPHPFTLTPATSHSFLLRLSDCTLLFRSFGSVFSPDCLYFALGLHPSVLIFAALDSCLLDGGLR